MNEKTFHTILDDCNSATPSQSVRDMQAEIYWDKMWSQAIHAMMMLENVTFKRHEP